MLLTLEQIKRHCNIDADFTEDDNYLLSLAQVAEEITKQHIDQDLNIGADGAIPTPLLQAMLLLVGHFYANRESVTYASAKSLPLGYEYLTSLYVKYNKE